MKKPLFIFLAHFLIIASSYAQWISVPSGTSYDLHDVHFPSDSVGYIAGEYGIILKSNDSGDSWEITQTDSSISFNSVFFITENTGFAAGSHLYKTLDGGHTWIRVITDSLEQMREVFFTNELLGFASGTYLYRTTDGGQSWESEYLDNVFSSIYFPTDSTGYFIGGSDFANPLYKTIDGGQSFIPIPNGYQSIKESVHFINEDVGFMCGWYAGLVAKTSNGGLSWEYVNPFHDAQCWGIYFADEHVGYYIDNSGGTHIIRKTVNGGADWNTQMVESNEGLHAFYFFDANRGVMVGKNGLIFKTINGGVITTINQTKHHVNVNIYPNPASDEIRIDPEDGFPENYIINIHSLLNQSIATFRTGNKINSFDIAHLPKGIYLIKISNDEGFELVKKLIKN